MDGARSTMPHHALEPAPSTPICRSKQTDVDQSCIPSACSTPSINYFDSPLLRKPSIASTITLADSGYASESSPILRNEAGWLPSNQSMRQKRVGVVASDTPTALVTAPVREESQKVQRVDSFDNLKIGTHIADGQWSKVYNADFDDNYLSPSPRDSYPRSPRPSSSASCGPFATPHRPSSSQSDHSVFAAKVGSGRSSAKILSSEARFLSFLMDRPCAREYVVDFHGHDVEKNMLVLENIPLTLEDYVVSMDRLPPHDRALKVKNEQLQMSRHLVYGLRFLHENKVVHGDIKPGNILVRQRPINMDNTRPVSEIWPASPATPVTDSNMPDDYVLEPVYCDFSAARFDDPESIPTQSAGTYDYMAPELFSRKTPDNYPTMASDIYALGVTLLFAAIGRSPYEFEHDRFRRRLMAAKGTPLDFVMVDVDSNSCSRLEEAHFRPFVERAVQPRACDRWTAAEWTAWMADQEQEHDEEMSQSH